MADGVTDAVPQNGNLSWGSILAIAMLTNPGTTMGVALPAIVDALIIRGLPSELVGAVIAGSGLGGALTILAAPIFIARINLRLCAMLSILLGALGLLLLMLGESLGVRLVGATLNGGSLSLLTATAVASISTASSPDRAFGVVVTVNQISSIIALGFIALLVGQAPESAAFLVMLALVASSCLFILSLPRRLGAGASAEKTGVPRPIPAAAVTCGIAGFFLFAASFGAVWPILGQLGLARGASAATISTTYVMASVGGMLGGAGTTLLGARLGRLAPLTAGIAGMAVSIYLLSSSFFVLAAVITLFLFCFSVPYFIGLQAMLDPRGRLAVLANAMVPLGIAVGQFVSGAAAARFGIGTIPSGVFVPLGISLLLMAIAVGLKDRTAGFQRPLAP